MTSRNVSKEKRKALKALYDSGFSIDVLEHCSKELRGDREVMLEAVR